LTDWGKRVGPVNWKRFTERSWDPSKVVWVHRSA
jgi:hypothetical protein